MNDKEILKSLAAVRKISKKRNFTQSFDLVINLKNLNLKKGGESVDSFTTLPYNRGKKVKICALVDEALAPQAKESCDKVILKNEFAKLGKKDIKNLTKEIEFFVAQANLMPQVAATFGKVLGPIGKMPNPKVGCVVPPGADLKPLAEKLQKTVRLQTKNELIVKATVGSEDMKDEEVVENILAIYSSLIHVLPQEKNNIKNILVKLTMSKPVKIGAKEKEKIVAEEKPKVKAEKVAKGPKEKVPKAEELAKGKKK